MSETIGELKNSRSYILPRHPIVAIMNTATSLWIISTQIPEVMTWQHALYIYCGLVLFICSSIHHWLPHNEYIHRFDQLNIWNYIAVQPIAFSLFSIELLPLLVTLCLIGFWIKIFTNLSSKHSNMVFLILGVTLFSGLILEAVVKGNHFSNSDVWQLFLFGNICYVVQLILYVHNYRTLQHAVLLIGFFSHTEAMLQIYT